MTLTKQMLHDAADLLFALNPGDRKQGFVCCCYAMNEAHGQDAMVELGDLLRHHGAVGVAFMRFPEDSLAFERQALRFDLLNLLAEDAP